MLTILAVLFCCLGLLLFLGGTIGILRLPDAYCRMHMSGKLDTLGSMSLMFGLVLYCWGADDPISAIVVAKLLLLLAFVFLTSPTAAHALADAGVRAGSPIWTRPAHKRSSQ